MKDLARAPLGRSGVEITRLGLGSAPLGGLFTPVSDSDAEATIARAWDLGVRYFDTAPLYGFGSAERRMGGVLRHKPRDSFVLSSKVGRLLRRRDRPPREDRLYKDTPEERPVFDYSYDGVMRSVDESLGRLGLDRIDVLYIHDPDNHHDEAIDGAFRALDQLRSDGSVRAIGAGMNQHEMLARFAQEAAFDCFLLAGRYSLLDQGALAGLFEICLAKGIGIVLGGVFNSGILANPQAGATFDYREADAGLIARAQRLDAICCAHGADLKAAAIQFALAHPAVSGIVLGARNTGEVEQNIAAAHQAVPAAVWQQVRHEALVDAKAPLPGGPA